VQSIESEIMKQFVIIFLIVALSGVNCGVSVL
jgi:hypothetical protein